MTLQTTGEVPAMSSRRRHRLLRLAIMLLIVWVVAAYFLLPIAWRLATRHHPIGIKDAPTHGEPAGAHVAKGRDEQFRRMATGTWNFDDDEAKRTMTLKGDGIGTMVVDLSGWRAALSAPRLRFDMVWSVEGGHLKKKTVGGEPATQVQIALKTIGDTADERILELTEQRLLLLDGDGKTKYDWRRVQK